MHRIGKVPRNLLSEKFLRLKTAKKISAMRTMRHNAVALITEAEKLADDAKEYHVKLLKEKDLTVLKGKRDYFEAGQQNVQHEKAQLAELCGEYFVRRPMTSVMNTNPIELRMHKAERLLQEFNIYFADIKDWIKILERHK